MSTARMTQMIRRANLTEKDRTWFPRGLKSFAKFVHALPQQDLEFHQTEVIKFLKVRKQSGRPAGQRLQAVRAIEFHRNLGET